MKNWLSIQQWTEKYSSRQERREREEMEGKKTVEMTVGEEKERKNRLGLMGP